MALHLLVAASWVHCSVPNDHEGDSRSRLCTRLVVRWVHSTGRDRYASAAAFTFLRAASLAASGREAPAAALAASIPSRIAMMRTAELVCSASLLLDFLGVGPPCLCHQFHGCVVALHERCSERRHLEVLDARLELHYQCVCGRLQAVRRAACAGLVPIRAPFLAPSSRTGIGGTISMFPSSSPSSAPFLARSYCASGRQPATCHASLAWALRFLDSLGCSLRRW